MSCIERTIPRSIRDVALKVLQPRCWPARRDESGSSPKRWPSRLNHPHVCTAYEIAESDGQTFIAMEYVRGRSLSSLIPAGDYLWRRYCGTGSQIADAVAHAHEHGIVHRDLKSANVIVTPEGVVKVLDFGLARRTDAAEDAAALTRSDVTAADAMLGTPAYMAPEVLLGSPADVRADVWGLGVILHEMAAGSRPFAGHTTAGLTSAIIKEHLAPCLHACRPACRRSSNGVSRKSPGNGIRLSAKYAQSRCTWHTEFDTVAGSGSGRSNATLVDTGWSGRCRAGCSVGHHDPA